MPSIDAGDWLTALQELPDASSRRELLSRHAAEYSSALVERMYQEVVRLTRVDLTRAQRIAEASAWVAEEIRDLISEALAHRAQGHVCYLTGNYDSALQHHRQAVRVYLAGGQEVDAARAMMNQLQPLIYLGKYDDAFSLADRAREIFTRHGDKVRIARLNTNMGNILYRQERFSEALKLYRAAQDILLRQGDVQDVAVLLSNMAVCYISMNQFEEALKTYAEVRDYSEKHELPLLVADADYNIAYLHYLRGEYTRAIALYQTARQLCTQLADHYHTALCDLDLSELYLELNLNEEGAALAASALAGFEALGMKYEMAKAIAFGAIAENQMRNNASVLRKFARARRIFVSEKNLLWPSLIDLYRAFVLADAGKLAKARPLAHSACEQFTNLGLVTRAALAELLLAKLDLRTNAIQAARHHCTKALGLLEGACAPAIEFQAVVTLSEVSEAENDRPNAYQSLLKAHSILEGLRSNLLGEAFRIGFLKDKLSVYESLVFLTLSCKNNPRQYESAFDYIERAKSRSLADLISFSTYALRPRSNEVSKTAVLVHELRERMTLTYRQAQREEFRADRDAVTRIRTYRETARKYEEELATASGQLQGSDRDFTDLLNAGTLPMEAIQASLPQEGQMIEYYQARGRFYACVLSKKTLQIVELCDVAHLRNAFRLLQFQISKSLLGPADMKRSGALSRASAETHLRDLYSMLIAPLRSSLQCEHLILIPHGFLHYLPFHALLDGNKALIDDFSISYAPSGSVYALCVSSPALTRSDSLVLGVPDQRAPQIREEAEAVAELLPEARLFLGDAATREVLWQLGPESRYIHIATHGLFRKDNPMFSAIRLGKSELNLFDLYNLRINAELVTLSGCGTGLNLVVGGDELLGLVRGLLYAGAKAVQVTLWDVNDESTSIFMKEFYRELATAPTKARAMQKAMQTVRSLYPDPYYWAPFLLIGDACTANRALPGTADRSDSAASAKIVR